MTFLGAGMCANRSAARPSPGERARSLAERGVPRLLCGEIPRDGAAPAVMPSRHHMTEFGDAMLLLPKDHPTSARVAEPRGPLPASLELTDIPPVPMIEPVRGQVWLVGRLHRVDRRTVLRTVDEMVEAGPASTLLRVNDDLTMVRFVVGMAILADGEGTEFVSGADFTSSEPDPFCHIEAAWMRHLERHYPHLLARLVRYACAESRRTVTTIRGLGLDRHGMRLRVHHGEGTTDIRLPFTRAISRQHELNHQLRSLSGTPFPDQPIP